ncbi:hypothetical protein HMPREF9148_00048 [Prevotella sp. F0091]|nr:hypothetical protein HMPREF9148_00048 [Prevotella sp. F0091]
MLVIKDIVTKERAGDLTNNLSKGNQFVNLFTHSSRPLLLCL